MINYPIENKVNASIIEYCKSLQGKNVTSGEVLARKLTTMVTIGLLTSQQIEIYNTLTENPKAIKDIAKESKISIPQVMAQLRRIYTQTQLISFKKEGKYKAWFKYGISKS